MLDLSHDRWQRLDDLLAEALERDPDERTAFLRAACGQDPDLYHAAVALVERAARAEADFGESATGFAAPMLDAQPEQPLELDSGASVGPYRIAGEIGRGGMGAVYLAERADGTFEKRVALKLVKRGMDTDEVLARFRRERRILAGLDHPGIARLLDAGATDDGRPYLVMEYVEGEPITAWAEARSLNLKARLELVGQVGEAVAYAHRRLVIHRDLKPSNILIAEDEHGRPQVKLLDFGIARLLDPETGDAMTQTTEQRLLTPAYASPEQLRGEAVSTATDVYALGVVLYELLTGQRPPEPLKPPSAVVDAERGRRLRSDLDTIILKTLREDLEARYVSVEALLDDLRRHRMGLPVQARPASAGYRMRRFVGRHRVGVAAAAGLVVLLAGFAIAMALQQAQTARALVRAEVEQAKAERVSAFMQELFMVNDPFEEVRGDTLTASALLERGLERVDDLEDNAEVQAQMLDLIGSAYQGMGQYEKAQPLLERGLALRQQVFGEEHEDVAQSLENLAVQQKRLGDYAAADSLFRIVLAMRRQVLGDDHLSISRTLSDLGTMLSQQGQHAEAEAMAREGLAMRHRVAPDDHVEIALALNELSGTLWEQGKPAEAEPLLREAYELYRQELDEDHPYVTNALGSLSVMAWAAGNLEDAERFVRETLAIESRTIGEDHPSRLSPLYNLGSILLIQNKPEEAEATFRKALELGRRTVGEDHPNVTKNVMGLGSALMQQQEYAEAERVYRQGIATNRRTLGNDDTNRWLALARLAKVVSHQQRYGEAEAIYDESLSLAMATYGETHPRTAHIQAELGECLTDQARYAEAEALMLQAYAILEANLPPEHTYVQEAREGFADLYAAWGQPEKTRPYQ